MFRKTKIIATIGPSSFDNSIIKHFSDLDVNCIRINTAHGDFKQYSKTIKSIRSVCDIPILIDIKGPEIRVRTNKDIHIKKNSVHTFFFKDNKFPHFSYDFFPEVKEGNKIFFDNGLIEGTIKQLKDGEVEIKFSEEAVLKQNKGVNIPNVSLKIPSLSDKDIEAVKFALEHNLAFIALSFVRNKQDVLNLKALLGDADIGIISKIENWEGVENIDEILDVSEGVMIARGDLGVEIEQEKIPIIQKQIIQRAIQKAKISIVATQMLESMTYNKSPTRAEISDVANAILDGADAVMLSGETAAGKYPVQAVNIMSKVALEVEDEVENFVDMEADEDLSVEMSKSAYLLMLRSGADKLVTITRSGYSANLLSRYRVEKPIIAVTDTHLTFMKLRLVRGVKPVLITDISRVAMITNIAKELVKLNFVSPSELIVFFAGVKTLQEKTSNLVEIHNVEDLLDYHSKVLNGHIKH